MICNEGNVINTVYFDMDGVLVDFVSGIEAATGMTIDEMDRMEGDFIGRFLVKHTPNGFFQSLPPTPCFEELKRLILELDGRYNVEILTAVGKSHPRITVKQKKMWLAKYDLDFIPFNYTFSGEEKGYFANKNSILIDDRGHCVRSFKENGGHAIKHKKYSETYEIMKKEFSL